jgi:hypothetical protein
LNSQNPLETPLRTFISTFLCVFREELLYQSVGWRKHSHRESLRALVSNEQRYLSVLEHDAILPQMLYQGLHGGPCCRRKGCPYGASSESVSDVLRAWRI